MKLASFLIPLVLIAAPVIAAEEKAAPAERLLDMMDFKGTSIAAAKASFKPTLDQFKKQGLPAEALQEISDAADVLFTKTFAGPEIRKAIVKLYESKFTAAELEELINFYNTPVGRKSLQAMPEIMAEAGQIGQESVQKDLPEFQAKLTDIMAKYQKKKGPAAPAKDDDAEEEKDK